MNANTDSQRCLQPNRQSNTSSFLKLIGNRISILFVLLNLFAFFKYLDLTSQAQLAATNDVHLESIVGSYQFHNASRRRSKVTESTLKRPKISPKTNTTSANETSNKNLQGGNEIIASEISFVAVSGNGHENAKRNNGDGGDNSRVIEKEKPSTNSTDMRKWAYAFLVGGARSERKDTEYFAGLCSVVAAAHELRKLGSRADMILLVQITAETSYEKLTDFEEEFLQKMEIKIVYIPKLVSYDLERFYSRKFNSFRFDSVSIVFFSFPYSSK